MLDAFTSQPFDLAEPQPLITDPRTRAVADLFNMGYEVLLQTLTRYFTHTDETPEQLGTLVNTALGLMTGVLRRLGNALTLLPVGPEHPRRTAGPTFQMYYQMGNFVPVREAAWLLLQQRVRLLADRCTGLATTDGMPEVVGAARSLDCSRGLRLKWLRVCVSPPRASSRRPRGPAPGPANPPRTVRSPGRAFAPPRRPHAPASPSRGSNRCRRENLRSRARGRCYRPAYSEASHPAGERIIVRPRPHSSVAWVAFPH